MMRTNMDFFHVVQMYVFWLICLTRVSTGEYEVGKFGVLMPKVHPYRPEIYFCTPVKVDYTQTYYIVGFEPNATMNVAHHMLLYGCGEPGRTQSVFNCGEMAKIGNFTEDHEFPCKPGEHSEIIYAWARDAPPLTLPDGVAFKVGSDSPIKYLVLQVHYATVDKFKDGSTDDSGVFLHYTTQPKNKQAGVLLLATGGRIEPMANEHMETCCKMEEDKVLHPFAYRTHTHSLGKVVAGYKVRRENGKENWIQLGKRDPLTPQMFYPIENSDPIVKGDILAARCTMQSTRDRVTYVGATNEHEMCNFYLMYYVDDQEPLAKKSCGSPGPPDFYWTKSEFNFINIPDVEASRL